MLIPNHTDATFERHTKSRLVNRTNDNGAWPLASIDFRPYITDDAPVSDFIPGRYEPAPSFIAVALVSFGISYGIAKATTITFDNNTVALRLFCKDGTTSEEDVYQIIDIDVPDNIDPTSLAITINCYISTANDIAIYMQRFMNTIELINEQKTQAAKQLGHYICNTSNMIKKVPYNCTEKEINRG